jgi:hypothetical protein
MNLKKFVITVASISALFASGYAFAARYYAHYSYYSDATHTTQVGTRINACNGQVYMSGTMTTFSVLDDRFNCNL